MRRGDRDWTAGEAPFRWTRGDLVAAATRLARRSPGAASGGAEASRSHPNVRFLDFYAQPDARLTNAMFYDVLHLNVEGAVVFTGILADRIAADLAAVTPPTGRAAVPGRT